MTHSFRFTEDMEQKLDRYKTVLSKLSGIPKEQLTDTQTIIFALGRIETIERIYAPDLEESSL